MKLMDENMESLSILGSKGSFNFSAVKLDELGSSEYTLVTIAVDRSGSVTLYSAELLKALKSIIKACKKAPRAENLLLRIIQFNQNLQELHGFKLLSNIDADNDYQEPNTQGYTSLFDAVYSSVGATLTYAKKLSDQNFGVNGISFIITDGMDNASKVTPKMIQDYLNKTKVGEDIESLITVLIGINTSNCATELEDFKVEANLTQFVDVGEATSGKLAKLATFVTKSISSQSQSLGTGRPSQTLNF